MKIYHPIWYCTIVAKTIIIFLYPIFQCIREKQKFPCCKQLEKVILLGSFWLFGHFNNFFCVFLYSLLYLRHLLCRRLSTVMTASVWINLGQKIPLSFVKVCSMTVSVFLLHYSSMDRTVDWWASRWEFLPQPIMVCFNSYVVKSFLSVS